MGKCFFLLNKMLKKCASFKGYLLNKDIPFLFLPKSLIPCIIVVYSNCAVKTLFGEMLSGAG